MPDTPPGPPDIPDITGGGGSIDTSGSISPFVYGPGGKAEAPDSPTKSGPIQYRHGPQDGPLPALPDQPVAPPPADDSGTASAPVTWGYTPPAPDPDAGGYGYHPHIDLGVGPYHLDPITPPQMPSDSGGDAQADPYGGGYGQSDPGVDASYAQADAYSDTGYGQGDAYADSGGYDDSAADQS